uniref:Nidogen-1-like n=1 Tax=Petromyzon marinus TaxID=7757 RepID=A0AAJ7TJ46_PETMA|nr:nidogen-1-like [Petromyzon marinus]
MGSPLPPPPPLLLLLRWLPLAALLAVSQLPRVRCLSRGELLSHGSATGDEVLPGGDDITSWPVNLAVPIPFFETTVEAFRVSVNGFVTPHDVPEEGSYVDGPLPTKFGVIAPFLADLETEELNGGPPGHAGGNVFFRALDGRSRGDDDDDAGAGRAVLDAAAAHVRRAFPAAGNFAPIAGFLATWDRVAVHANPGQVNTFQAAIVSDKEDTYAVFLYPEGGLSVSGTAPKEARGDRSEVPARVGFSRGPKVVFIFSTEGPSYHVTHGGVPATSMPRRSNSGRRGVWAFHIGSSRSAFSGVEAAEVDAEPPTPGAFDLSYDDDDDDEEEEEEEEYNTEEPEYGDGAEERPRRPGPNYDGRPGGADHHREGEPGPDFGHPQQPEPEQFTPQQPLPDNYHPHHPDYRHPQQPEPEQFTPQEPEPDNYHPHHPDYRHPQQPEPEQFTPQEPLPDNYHPHHPDYRHPQQPEPEQFTPQEPEPDNYHPHHPDYRHPQQPEPEQFTPQEPEPDNFHPHHPDYRHPQQPEPDHAHPRQPEPGQFTPQQPEPGSYHPRQPDYQHPHHPESAHRTPQPPDQERYHYPQQPEPDYRQPQPRPQEDLHVHHQRPQEPELGSRFQEVPPPPPRHEDAGRAVLHVDEPEPGLGTNVFVYGPERGAERCDVGGGPRCSPHAACRDHATGPCCHCGTGYYGDGKLCLPEGAPQRVNGKVSGRLVVVGDSSAASSSETVELSGSDLHSYVVVNDGRAYAAVSQVPVELGWSMLPLYSLGTAVGWMLALEQPGFQNGFSITGGRFVRTSEVTFLPGRERVVVTQRLDGMDEHGHLVIDTRLSGSLPRLPPDSKVSVEPYEELYQYTRNVVTSTSLREYVVDYGSGRTETFRQTWKQNITYQSCPHDDGEGGVQVPHTQRLSVGRIFTLYDASGLILRYATTNKIGSITDEADQSACYDGTHDCDNNAQCRPGRGADFTCECAAGFTGDGRVCYDQDECAEYPGGRCGPHARCVNLPGTFRCECDEGHVFSDDGRSCVPSHRAVNPCDDGSHNCDYADRSRCVATGPAAFRCECLAGYTGNGRVCTDVDECSASRCHSHGVCHNSPGSFSCRCNPGYEGDGFQCSPVQNGGGGGKSTCERWRDSLVGSSGGAALLPRGPRPVGHYVPQCGADGTFLPVQCHHGTGYCWCVDAEGQEQAGTRTPPGTEPPCLPTAAPPVVRPTHRPDVVPPPPGTSLVFAQGQLLSSVPLDGTALRKEQARAVLVLHGTIVVGVAHDCVENKVYWTDIATRTISRASLHGGEPEVIVRTDLRSPEGLAIDHLGRNVFWTDSGSDRIEVARLDGSHRRVLFDTGLVNPRAIVADPSGGLLYWTDWNRESPRIETANMDGTGRRVLVGDDLGLPNGLTFDPYSHQLCWADAGTRRLECMHRGQGPRRRFLEGLQYPFGIAAYADHLYYTDWRRDAVVAASLGQQTDEHTPTQRSHPYGIATVYPQCPPGQNHCSGNNGGCTHLCLATPGGRTCRCPDNVVGVSCQERN